MTLAFDASGVEQAAGDTCSPGSLKPLLPVSGWKALSPTLKVGQELTGVINQLGLPRTERFSGCRAFRAKTGQVKAFRSQAVTLGLVEPGFPLWDPHPRHVRRQDTAPRQAQFPACCLKL